MKKELLAPAGDIEAGYAALYYGADAVYLGLKRFSARANANNFSEEELNEFSGFAHSLGKKVFVTINTIVQTNEIYDLINSLDICVRCKVDAIIIQDLGVARIVKKYYPDLEMHASTQMAVHNKQGALALKEMGFKRVVLARELSLSEIKDIASIKGLDLECFIHGALCYSYSGICQFSSMTKSRSANRGKCAYPCRAEFIKDGKAEHCFSMKDMALQEDILKLPVLSLKIEGRKKNALYVAAVTDYYRSILDGKSGLAEKAQNIKQIFSRPWCEFHFKGKNKDITDKKFVGHRGLAIGRIESIMGKEIILKLNHKIARHDGIQIDVEGLEKPYGFSLQKLRVNKKIKFEALEGEKAEILLPEKVEGLKVGAMVYLASSSEVKGAYGYMKPRAEEFYQGYEIKVNVKVENKVISAESNGKKATIEGDFAKAQNIEKMAEAIKKSFEKTGGTKLKLKNLEVKNDEGLFVPVSILNDLRRKLYEQIKPEYQTPIREEIIARKLTQAQKWIIKTDNINNLRLLNLDEFEEIIYLINPESKVEEILSLPKNKLRIALPAVCKNVNDFDYIITKLLDMGYKKWEISNYWGLGILPKNKVDISLDNLVYMANNEAVEMAKENNISRFCFMVEDSLDNIKGLNEKASLPAVMVVYQDVVLFTSQVCIRDNACNDCTREDKWMSLENNGEKYSALSRNCQTFVFADMPYSVAEYAKEVKCEFLRADFCYKNYTPEQVKHICDEIRQYKNLPKSMKGNINNLNNVF